jgi:hypothetical protein
LDSSVARGDSESEYRAELYGDAARVRSLLESALASLKPA